MELQDGIRRGSRTLHSWSTKRIHWDMYQEDSKIWESDTDDRDVREEVYNPGGQRCPFWEKRPPNNPSATALNGNKAGEKHSKIFKTEGLRVENFSGHQVAFFVQHREQFPRILFIHYFHTPSNAHVLHSLICHRNSCLRMHTPTILRSFLYLLPDSTVDNFSYQAPTGLLYMMFPQVPNSVEPKPNTCFPLL